jgi:hypothetical protein
MPVTGSSATCTEGAAVSPQRLYSWMHFVVLTVFRLILWWMHRREIYLGS